MKNLILASALTLGLFGAISEGAHADFFPGTPIWGCTIKAKLVNNSVALIVGVVDKSGPAKVNCYSLENLVTGEKFTKNVYVEIIGPAVGIDLNFVDQQTVYMATSELGLRDWRQLLGKHSLSLAANVNLLVLEAGVSAGIEFSDSMLALRRSAEISKTEGIGATFSLQAMNIYQSKAGYLAAKTRRKANFERLTNHDRD